MLLESRPDIREGEACHPVRQTGCRRRDAAASRLVGGRITERSDDQLLLEGDRERIASGVSPVHRPGLHPIDDGAASE